MAAKTERPSQRKSNKTNSVHLIVNGKDYTLKVGGNLDQVALRVTEHTFVIAVTGRTRTVEQRAAAFLQLPGKVVDLFHRTEFKRYVGIAKHMLATGFGGHSGALHDLQAGASIKCEEIS